MMMSRRFALCLCVVFCAQGAFAAGISSAILKRNDVKRLKLEIKKDADVNGCDWFGRTALMRSVRFNALDCAKLLISNGADINAKDKNGWTALIWASVECSSSAVSMLLEKGADADIRDNLGYNALMFAEDKKCDEVRAMLKEAMQKKSFRNKGRRISGNEDDESK